MHIESLAPVYREYKQLAPIRKASFIEMLSIKTWKTRVIRLNIPLNEGYSILLSMVRPI